MGSEPHWLSKSSCSQVLMCSGTQSTSRQWSVEASYGVMPVKHLRRCLMCNRVFMIVLGLTFGGVLQPVFAHIGCILVLVPVKLGQSSGSRQPSEGPPLSRPRPSAQCVHLRCNSQTPRSQSSWTNSVCHSPLSPLHVRAVLRHDDSSSSGRH